MKKIFLIIILSLGLVFGIANTSNAQPSQIGCCENKSSGNKIESVQTDCAGFQEDWVPGPCPVPKTPNSNLPPQDTQSGCKPDGEGIEKCKLENPIGVGPEGTTEVADIISIFIKSALALIGSFALIMLVWGGFQWLTSAGNPEKVSAGTQTMVWAVIGVMVVLASYLLLSIFLDFLTRG